MINAYTL